MTDMLVNQMLDVLCMVPPFRDFTNKLYTELILVLKPDFTPSAEQRYKLFEAFASLVETLRGHIKKMDPRN